MKNYQIGLLLIAFTIVIGVLNWSYSKALSDIVNTQCTHGLSCPMQASLRAQESFSSILMYIVIAVSAYFIFIDYVKKYFFYAKAKIAVSPEEHKIYELVKKGNVSQTELIKETGITKVRMTRILNRLENKGIIERKRNGASNIVQLKTKLS